VLQELFAGADDNATVKNLLNIKKFYEKVDRLLVLTLLRCKNSGCRLVVSAFKNPFSWTFGMKFYGAISLEPRKFVGHLNRGSCLCLMLRTGCG